MQAGYGTTYSDHSWEDILARLGCTDQLVILKKPFDNIEVLQLASALTQKWRLDVTVSQRLRQLEALAEQSGIDLGPAYARRSGTGGK